MATGKAAGLSLWNDVQEGSYRYQVSLNADDGITVKIFIFEILLYD